MPNFRVAVNGKTFEVNVEEIGSNSTGAPKPADEIAAAKDQVDRQAVETEPAQTGPVVIEAGDKPIVAPLSGSVTSIKVKPGESVKYGQVLLTLEALKMENEIVAPEAGVVNKIFVPAGAAVSVGDILLSLK